MKSNALPTYGGFEITCWLIGGFLIVYDLAYLVETAISEVSLRALAQRFGTWNNQLVAGLAIAGLGLLVWMVRLRREAADGHRDKPND